MGPSDEIEVSATPLTRKFYAADGIICKAVGSAAVVNLPQATDNEANECISLRPLGKIYLAFSRLCIDTNCILEIYNLFSYKPPNTIAFLNILKRSYESFGLSGISDS
jgi:hypothetical protein